MGKVSCALVPVHSCTELDLLPFADLIPFSFTDLQHIRLLLFGFVCLFCSLFEGAGGMDEEEIIKVKACFVITNLGKQKELQTRGEIIPDHPPVQKQSL